MRGKKIIVEHLEASGTSLYTLTAGRVRADRLPPGFDNTEAAVIVRNQALTSEVDIDIDTDRYQIRCYGGSDEAADADAVFEAVKARLHAQQADTTTGGVVFGRLETASSTYETDTGWPVVIAVFQIKTA